MKKLIVLSLAAAAILFTGCGEETKKAAEETATAAKKTAEVAVEETKDVTNKVVASVEEKVDQAIDTTKETTAPIVEAAEEKVAEATEAVKEAVTSEANASDTASNEEVNASSEEEVVADNEVGKTLYVKCSSCHGIDGKMKALGKSELLAGQSAAVIETKIKEYKAGTRNVAGMGAVMNPQAAGLSDEDIKAVAAYISTL